jgi:hypothetical protein
VCPKSCFLNIDEKELKNMKKRVIELINMLNFGPKINTTKSVLFNLGFVKKIF